MRTKLERNILADVNHPFIVKLQYAERSKLEERWWKPLPLGEPFFREIHTRNRMSGIG